MIDNASTDRTVDVLREISGKSDKRVKVIVNTRNFGNIRSPYYGLLQGQGDAVTTLVADLQDPPTMIKDFISWWERVARSLSASSRRAREPVTFFVRRRYYWLSIGSVRCHRYATSPGSGCTTGRSSTRFGRSTICTHTSGDSISELGYARVEILYSQPSRKSGIRKNNFYSLYDLAMLGITNHSKVPLRIAAIAGFVLSVVAVLIAFAYLVLKLPGGTRSTWAWRRW